MGARIGKEGEKDRERKRGGRRREGNARDGRTIRSDHITSEEM